MIAPNSLLQNRYRVVRLLGQGGMGAVYEAIDQRVNCLVALKQTLTGHDGEARLAFEREAALLANLRHPALPKVMDYFSEEAGDFLVMEFIPGHDLAELLSLRGHPFPHTQVLQWAYDLLRVLEYLHSQEPPILHRDIKPSNLKLTKRDEIFLLDFGLAKGSLGQMPTLVTSRSVRGYTPVYAPLEQILGQGTDRRSDIYSVGATLYHLLAGVPPVDAPARYQASEEDQADPLPALERVNREVPERVAAVIHKSMSVARKNRFGSASEMLAALREAASEELHAEARIAQAPQVVGEAETWKRSDKGNLLPLTRPAREPAIDDAKDESAPAHPRDTIPAPPLELYKFEPKEVPAKVEPGTRFSRRAKTILAATAAVLLILSSGYVFWLVTKNRNQNTLTQQNPAPTANEQPSPIPSPSPAASPSPSPSPTPVVPRSVTPSPDFIRFAQTEAGPAARGEIDAREVDLDQDGVPELIAQIESCGSGGCTTRVFKRNGARFQQITGDMELYLLRDLNDARVEAGPRKTNGYLDIKYDRQTFTFNGRQYLCSRGC
ncbi:MAG TPA: serine/threonine-protein kinase [Pyrinomonadaceae bacterium]|nr:serine/threonine-protein kinase [Pyrinomonadaceae bacterium]